MPGKDGTVVCFKIKSTNDAIETKLRGMVASGTGTGTLVAADPGYGLRSSRLVGKSETMGLSVGAREYYANKEEIQLINRYGVLPHCPCCATACLPLSRVLPLVGEVPHSPGPAPFPTLLCSRTHPPGRACGTRACASETTTLVLFAALPKSSQPVLPGPLHPAPPFASVRVCEYAALAS